MKKGLPKWAVVGLSLVIVGGLGYLAYKHFIKKDQSDKAPEPGTIPEPTNSGSATNLAQAKSSGVNTGVFGSTKPKTVVVTKKGTGIYTSDGKAVTRKTTTDNEEVGPFVRYGTINGKVYVLFADKFNQNRASLVLKDLTTLK